MQLMICMRFFFFFFSIFFILSLLKKLWFVSGCFLQKKVKNKNQIFLVCQTIRCAVKDMCSSWYVQSFFFSYFCPFDYCKNYHMYLWLLFGEINLFSLVCQTIRCDVKDRGSSWYAQSYFFIFFNLLMLKKNYRLYLLLLVKKKKRKTCFF